ncbi:hypothetical protein GGX14DRAFT_400388 [Mycena pura]|uniref:Uncharacterized protein n=1 Tax=Mycena pura TaxID=153505 RepID=A0AAD6V2V0_9AGAR|nr:hypothetical protein GGX14DRAFT_400388 [Mycena pura]
MLTRRHVDINNLLPFPPSLPLPSPAVRTLLSPVSLASPELVPVVPIALLHARSLTRHSVLSADDESANALVLTPPISANTPWMSRSIAWAGPPLMLHVAEPLRCDTPPSTQWHRQRRVHFRRHYTVCMSVLSRTARAVPAANSECPIAYRCMLLPFEAAAPCPPLNDGRWPVARRSTSVQHLNGGGHGVVLGGGTHPASPTHTHSSASVRPSPPGPQRPEQSSALVVLVLDAGTGAGARRARCRRSRRMRTRMRMRRVRPGRGAVRGGLEYAVFAVALHADAFGAPEMRVGQLPEPSGSQALRLCPNQEVFTLDLRQFYLTTSVKLKKCKLEGICDGAIVYVYIWIER